MVVLPAVQMYLLLQDELQFALPVGLKFPFEKEISYIFFSFLLERPEPVCLKSTLSTGFDLFVSAGTGVVFGVT